MKLRKTDRSGIIMFLNFLFLFSLNIDIDASKRVGQRVIPFVLLLVLSLFFVLFYLDQITDWMNNGVFIWYAIFSFYIVLSLVWALRPRKYEFANFKNFIIILALLFIYGAVIQKEEDLILCLKSIVWANMGSAIVMVKEMGMANLFSGRAGGAIGMNANLFGSQCVFAALLSFYLYEKNNKKIYLFIIGVLSLMALLSGSRKAFFILVMGIALYELSKMEEGHIIRNILIMTVLLAILLYAVVKVPQFYNIIGFRLEAMFSEGKDGSISERQFFKQEAMRLFSQRPILGSGFDGFKTHLSIINYWNPAYSHCNYTEVLSTLGIVGAIIYYSMYVYLFAKSYNKKDSLSRILLICLLCIIVSEYGAVCYNSTMYMILIGLLYFRIKNTKASSINKYIISTKPKKRAMNIVMRAETR